MRSPVVFNITLGELSEIPGMPYAYWALKSLRELFQKFPPLDRDIARQPDQPKIADVKQGLATADDLRFTRYWWEVPVEQIATSREETFEGKKWVPFAKGGKPFFHDIPLVVNWGNDGEEVKNYRDDNGRLLSRPQNESFYFQEGLTFPNIVSSIRVNTRIISDNSIFTVKHQGIFTVSHQDNQLCAFLNSLLAAVLHHCMNPLKHGRDTGELSKMPINPAILQSSILHSLACEAHDLLREWSTGDETSTLFVIPWVFQAWLRWKSYSDVELSPRSNHPLCLDFRWSDWTSSIEIRQAINRANEKDRVSLFSLADQCIQWEAYFRQRVEEILRQIDDEVYRLYEISSEGRALIESDLGKPREVEEGENESAESIDEGSEEAAPEGIMPTEEHTRRLVHYFAHEAIRTNKDGIVPLFDCYITGGRFERGIVYLASLDFHGHKSS